MSSSCSRPTPGSAGGRRRTSASGRSLFEPRGSGVRLQGRLVCDGVPHRYTVRVVASIEGPPFQPGEALGQAAVEICATIDGQYTCSSDSWGPKVITLVPA